MLLFSRQLTLVGNPRKTMPWAMEITAYVNAHSTLDVSLWAANFGLPIGTVAWTSIVESQAQLAAAAAPLITDSGYLDLIEGAADMVNAPAEDQLAELIYGGVEGGPAEVGSIAQVTTATAIVDEIASAFGWAVEIAQHVEKITGTSILVLSGLFGTMGSIAWIGIAPDFAAVDASSAKLAADSTYVDRLSKTKGLFIPGSGHVSQTVRIA